MLGNFVVGTSVLAPAGMLQALSGAFDVSVHEASLLITLGAVVLCLGTPVVSWATSRMDRRVLLGGSLLVLAAAQLASALTSSFAMLLVCRLVMLAAAAPFTPQAAGVVGLLVPVERRASTISFIFLGWSLAAALGIPLVSMLADRTSWQISYLTLAGLALASFALLVARLPSDLRTAPVDLGAWGALVRDASVRRLLLLTVLLTAGQFSVFTFLGPLLARLTHASPDAIGIAFALFGASGFVGNVLATRAVGSVGAFRTSLGAVLAMALGVAIWAIGAGSFAVMTLGLGVWGLGFASSNSMQQARLVATAPLHAGAAVALNSSSLYVGQALGSALGGMLFARDLDRGLGYASLAIMIAALGVLLATRPRPAGRALDVAVASARKA